MDRKIKIHYDNHRSVNILPSEIEGQISKGLVLYPDQKKIDSWRNYFKKTLTYSCPDTGGTLGGALDDLLQDKDNRVAPLDYKTRGYPIKEDSHKYYITQMNCYALMLSEGPTQLELNGKAYLVFYSPRSIISEEKPIGTNIALSDWLVEVVELKIDIEAARKLVRDAVDCLQSAIPWAARDCEQCKYIEDRIDMLRDMKKAGEKT